MEDYSIDGDDDSKSDSSSQIFAQMDDDTRKKYNHFNSDVCKIPQTAIKNIMKKAIPEDCQIGKQTIALATFAAKCFAMELIHTARSIQGGDEPIRPDSIMLAYQFLEEHGNIPGKRPGQKRAGFR